MRLHTGLNPYGLSYHLGLHAAGTPRANPHPAGLPGYIALAREFGARSIELWDGVLLSMSAPELDALRHELVALGMIPIVSARLAPSLFARQLEIAAALDAPTIRLALTTVLCGDRAVCTPPWPDRVAAVRNELGQFAHLADAAGKTLAIENHQDFTSRELVSLCQDLGPSVGITYDTGNSFPVGEAPLDFTAVIAPYVRHIHLKDYTVQPTPEGFRLVRCALGDGAVPFTEILAVIGAFRDEVTAVMELAALEARHVRLLTDAWWRLYPPRDEAALARCLAATTVNALAADADYRTPWEKGDDAALATYELDMIRRSAANMRAMGIL
ncbi:sugar phosphate isomerase/epimerase family protein [Devosia aquimaris]|uniref:sugar phosphate isomerase/epimerase family protein n=1 Tax=Devosia aquimaris TaxID=2866214 RepID=UPI001CD0C44E|nr:sugar phosphate isomerase/epimerase [Devosia sp. CJK-A8-3]